jgi:hypothetical protein
VVKRFFLSNGQLELGGISAHHSDSEASLKLYFSEDSKEYFERFSSDTTADVKKELKIRIEELSHTSSLSLLAALEAAFRIDYLQRNYKRKKDPLSRTFRAIYKDKDDKASLERDIFDAWKINGNGLSQIIGNLKGAFKYRHWLAHGRYWQPKWGNKKYDYGSVYELAVTVLKSFPFEK